MDYLPRAALSKTTNITDTQLSKRETVSHTEHLHGTSHGLHSCLSMVT